MLRVRAFWLRLPCSSTVGTPLLFSWRVSALAPCLVRVKTTVRPGALVRSTSTGTRFSRETCRTWWSICEIGDCAESAWWVTGWLRKRLTRTSMALSSVAEKSSRWPCAGVLSSRRRTAGRKPRSAMWSASSRIVISIWERSQWPCLMRSSSRPGQAMTTSMPRRRPATWGFWPTPPKTVWVLRPEGGGQRLEGLGDLADQLPGGGEDQGAGHGRAGLAVRRHEAGDERQQERVRLAGAGAAAAEDVAAGQRVGQGRGLDRGGVGDAAVREDADQLGGDAQLGEAVGGGLAGRRSRACGQEVRRHRRSHSRVVCLTTLVPSATELEKRSLHEGGARSGLRAGDARRPEARRGGQPVPRVRHRAGPTAIRAGRRASDRPGPWSATW